MSQRKKLRPEEVEISTTEFDAVLFDMDGVVTRTAKVHMKAWKATFDAFLHETSGDGYKPFTKKDYLDYVDGKPREEGVKCFLKSRKIASRDVTDRLAKAKDKTFMHIVHTEGVESYETTVALIKELRGAGIRTALVTASRNGAEILKLVKLAGLFDTIVTGVEVQELGLRGKPAPDMFLQAAKNLKVKPGRAVVVEDAEAGVQAGSEGKFGKVIGVAREHNKTALRDHGATDVVVDLSEVHVPESQVSRPNGAGTLGMTLSDLGLTDANWVVAYDSYDPKDELKRESLCTLGNGKFFTRGAFTSVRADGIHYPGMYVAGAYNSIWLDGEDGNVPGAGGKFEREELVNMPNWLCLGVKIIDDQFPNGGDDLSIDECEIVAFSQKLHLKHGILYRDFSLRDNKGRETQFTERRFVHMKHSHLAGTELSIKPLNWAGKAIVRTAIDGSITNNGDPIDPKFRNTKHLIIQERDVEGDLIYLKAMTSKTGLTVAQIARTEVRRGSDIIKVERRSVLEDEYVGQDLMIECERNQSVAIQKTVAMCTSRDRGIYEAGTTAREFVVEAHPFEQLVDEHIKAWRSLWTEFDLFIETIEECPKLVPSLLLHLNSFHTLQTASTHTVDLDNGVPARGWTGEGYQGHVFWDELFVFPFINFRLPNISASLLKYRYRRLREARNIARSYGARGACFPWQSASDGKERTPAYWWMPSKQKWIRDYTHLEIHVNVAIAYNVWQYYQVTEDLGFMYSYGSEIIIEIARFLSTFATLNEKSGRYEIKGVIGPDEFHNGYPDFKKPGIDNNAYTNIMTSWVLRQVTCLIESLPSDHRQHIEQRLSVTDEEIELWKQMSKLMFVPVMQNGIIAQFEGYDELDEFPGFDETGKIDHDELKRRLDENLGYLNQYKVSKQADLLMLGYLFTQKELNEIIRYLGYPSKLASLQRMAAYYIPRTSNDSTLSRVAIAWVLKRLDSKAAAKIVKVAQDGNKKARKRQESKTSGFDFQPSLATTSDVSILPEDTPRGMFYAALGSDYYNVAARGTAASGIHLGAMAGTVDIVQRCSTGISLRDGVLWVDPVLPEQLLRLRFTLHYRGQSLHFDIDHDRLKIHASHSGANPIKIGHCDRLYGLKAGQTRTIRIKIS